ncbi:MAG: glycosyltransferase family 39 protein, partial [Candidatus Eremiobacteraeota bacterium]|nr:glycosyltransferase family 39 protein [Candidatus Eremiobacteraeota bacterium]
MQEHIGTERPARAAIAGAVIAALITLPGLGAGSLWDNSETAYGEVAREILLTHDWVVMHLNGHPWYVQPPLYFWIGAIFAKLFGVTSLALRLPAALATIAMGAMTGYAVARQVGTRAGVFAATILSSCLMQAVVGRMAIMDALLDLTVALSIFWWFRALQTGRDRYWIFGWIAASLGFLVKGPVAPVCALLVIVPYAIWNARAEQTRLPSARAWIVSLLAFVLIVVPWFVALGVRDGFAAVQLQIVHYTIGRYTGVIENQAGPFWYYVPAMIIGFFPWIAFLPVALVWGVARLRKGSSPETGRLLRLAIVWIVAPLLFFSAAKTKLPNYIALELPALALLTGMWFDDLARSGKRRLGAIVSGATVPVVIGLMAIAIVVFVRDNKLAGDVNALLPDLVVMGGSVAIGAIVALICVCSRRLLGYAPYALGISMLVMVDVLAIIALPHAEAFKPVPKLAQTIQAERRAGDVVAIQSVSGGNALVFYTQPTVQVLAAADAPANDQGESARSSICAAPRAFVIAPAKRPAFDPTYGRNRRI